MTTTRTVECRPRWVQRVYSDSNLIQIMQIRKEITRFNAIGHDVTAVAALERKCPIVRATLEFTFNLQSDHIAHTNMETQ